MNELTPQMVRDYWSGMLAKFGASVADKSSSWQMQVVSVFLGRMGITDRSEFLSHYATTVGTRIYTPFTPGEPNAEWNLRSQVIVCAHECHHVHQYKTLGAWMFAYQYLMSTARRTLLEVEAYRVNMELTWRMERRLLSPATLARKLTAYGVKDEDVAVAERMLTASVPTVQAGGITSPASKEAIFLLASQGALP